MAKRVYFGPMQFVFHGLNRSELVDVWNDQKKTAEGDLEVSLEFTHGDKHCKIVRTVHFQRHGNTFIPSPRVYLWIDGQEVTDQIEDKITQMLPKECQQFVFFDGAEITRYAQKQHEEGVRDAIERVLGIPAVRNLRTDLAKLIDDLEEEQASLKLHEAQGKTLRQELEDLKAQESHYDDRKNDLLQKYRSIKQAMDRLDKEAMQMVAIEAEQQQLREKNRRRADLEDKRRAIDNEIAELLKQAPLYLLMPVLRQVVEQFQINAAPSPYQEKLLSRKQVLEGLLEETSCICGRGPYRRESCPILTRTVSSSQFQDSPVAAFSNSKSV
ncbi:MAG: hypothetical protein KatS3mg131_2336 [Candidatus Tectimicrobiota bacterium]|nr:MAG: hypothetical protein KatS3mg131_2336 [Candidatus Tectomicrobia bacterium]